MIKKSIVAIVAIIAAVGLVFAAYGGTGNTEKNSSSDSNNLEKQQSSVISSNVNIATKKEDTKNMISASKAKEIAQKYIEVSTATAGTPKLIKSGETMIYVVPVIDNGQVVGEIEINAQTGENVGGAGGA